MTNGLSEVPNKESLPKANAPTPVPKTIVPTLDTGCPSYQPIKGIPFSSQVKGDFNAPLALWMTNMTIYAYSLYCNSKVPITSPDLSNITPLYWHEALTLFTEKVPCGFIAQIKPLPNDPTNRILISFRGTEKTGEWLDNLDSLQISILPKPLTQTIKLHDGFWHVYADTADLHNQSLQEQIHTLLPQYLSKTAPNEIYIAGHSLGGAIATIVMADCLLRYPDATIVSYTIGSPRVGNRSLSTTFHELAKNPKYHFTYWRIANTEDIVTTVPLPKVKDLTFSHIPLSATTLSNTFGIVSFTSNLGNILDNHHPMTYFYGIKDI